MESYGVVWTVEWRQSLVREQLLRSKLNCCRLVPLGPAWSRLTNHLEFVWCPSDKSPYKFAVKWIRARTVRHGFLRGRTCRSVGHH